MLFQYQNAALVVYEDKLFLENVAFLCRDEISSSRAS
jgi:hypothetical protein